jgi:Type VI secretion system, TssO
MQQVLNSQERRQAFFKFLLFFVITLVLVIWAVFFNFSRLPLKESDVYRQELQGYRAEEANQTTFVDKMKEAVLLLDSLDKPGVNANIISYAFDSKLSEVTKYQSTGNSLFTQMDKEIIFRLQQAKEQKIKIKKMEASTAGSSELQAALEKCRNEVITLNGQLDAYRKGSF